MIWIRFTLKFYRSARKSMDPDLFPVPGLTDQIIDLCIGTMKIHILQVSVFDKIAPRKDPAARGYMKDLVPSKAYCSFADNLHICKIDLRHFKISKSIVIQISDGWRERNLADRRFPAVFGSIFRNSHRSLSDDQFLNRLEPL